MSGDKQILCVVIIVVVVLSIALGGLFAILEIKSYEQCMMRKMYKQPSSMHSLISDHCKAITNDSL